MLGARPKLLLPAILVFISTAAWGQSPDEPARGLAQKIAAALESRQPAILSVRNASSAGTTDIAAARAALERELRAVGIRIADRTTGGAEIAVTLSESL